jgi:lipopolysaccharide/colanic/teichoic acid biosynthesis glycosyltransferase
LKSAFDFLFSLVGLILLFPILIIVSIILIIAYKSLNILFIQKRIGKNGRLFKIYKFRTMVLNDLSNSISVKGDNRITSIGEFLRKYKLDELPELLNIIKGEMSFVGPRPDVPGYMDKLDGDDMKVLQLKPGITGPASLKYINEEEILCRVDNPKEYNDQIIFPDKVRINKLYIEKWTLWLDIKIIFHTILRRPYKEENYF